MHDDDLVFKALADPTRRLLLEVLQKRPDQSLFELVVRLIENHGQSISRQGVSKHLAILESAGLVEVSWHGTTKLHRLNPAPIEQHCATWIAGLVQQGGDRSGS